MGRDAQRFVAYINHNPLFFQSVLNKYRIKAPSKGDYPTSFFFFSGSLHVKPSLLCRLYNQSPYFYILT